MAILHSLFSSIWSIFGVILFFGGSIFIHELGHFWAAKKKHLFVPKFSIGFGPKLISWTKNGTEFCISLLPLGGYVTLPQLMDFKELEGSFALPDDLQPITSKDKIIVAAMGAIFNLLFAFFLACILWFTGINKPQSMITNTIGYVHPTLTLPNGQKVSGPAATAGLKTGDKILSIDGHRTSNFPDIMYGIALGKNRDSQKGPLSEIKIFRDGRIFTTAVSPILIEQNKRSKESLRIIGIEPFQQLFLAEIYQNSPAYSSGLMAGDKILSVNQEKIHSFSQLSELLQTNSELSLQILRGNEDLYLNITPKRVVQKKPYVRLMTRLGLIELMPNFSKHKIDDDVYNIPCDFEVLSVAENFSNHSVDIAPGDTLDQINGKTVKNFAELSEEVNKCKDCSLIFSKNSKKISVKFEDFEITPAIYTYSLGVAFDETRVLVHQDPFSHVLQNFRTTFFTLNSLISSNSDVHFKNLMGPPGIIKTLNSFAANDFRLLFLFVITLNVNLAIFNLLPLPILDGGIIALTLIEKLIRKKIPLTLIGSIQFIFMILFLALVIYVSFFDINRIIGDNDRKREYEKQIKLYVDEASTWNYQN